MNDGKIHLDKLYAFLKVFRAERVACRHDIYHSTGLAVGTISKCLALSIQGRLIQNAGGDNRRQDFRLTGDGIKLLDTIERMMA